MRCVLGTGLLGWEDTILARQGPSSSREQGSEKGGKAEVQAAGPVKAQRPVTLSSWASQDDAPALGVYMWS